MTAGDNFRDESFSVAGDAATVAGQVHSALQTRLGSAGQVYVLQAQGVSPPGVEIVFTGRNGCAGSVEVFLDFVPAHDNTTINVNGHCED